MTNRDTGVQTTAGASDSTQMFDPKMFYTLDQAAGVCQVHRDTLRRAIARGDLRANKVGAQFRISGGALNEYVEPYSGQVAA